MIAGYGVGSRSGVKGSKLAKPNMTQIAVLGDNRIAVYYSFLAEFETFFSQRLNVNQ